METGTVKWFSVRRNFGFIDRDTGPDVFVHGSEIEGYQLIAKGDKVTFEVEETPRGPNAKNVELV
jgi:CspA family cold shock protein